MVFIGALLTGLGYDDIGKDRLGWICSSNNWICQFYRSPAMEFKREGYVFGVAAKMFVVAGPVLVDGSNIIFYCRIDLLFV